MRMRHRSSPAILLLLTLALTLTGCASAPAGAGAQQPLASVDIDRYMGDWYIIANVPYFAEKGHVAARAGYRRLDAERIEDTYYYRRDFGAAELKRATSAQIVRDSGGAHWKVRFYGVFNADYLILEVDPDYRYALVGHPSREYAWVLAREATIDDALYARLRARLDQLGYDSGRLRKIAQVASDVGREGYQW